MLTVTTRAESYDLTTLADLKAELGISGSSADARLAAVITQASDAISRWCHRVFAMEIVQETLRPGRLDDELILTRFPLVDVTVTVGGEEIDATTYEVDVARGILHRLGGSDSVGCWPSGIVDPIVVDYSAGYVLPGNEDADLPPALERASRELARAYWFSLNRDPAIRSEGIPDLADVTYRGEALPAMVRGLLAPFRDRRLR